MTVTTVYRSTIYSFLFYNEISTRTYLTRSPQFRHVPAVLSHSSRSLLLLSPTCVLFFYSPPLGRDLWTRVRWPAGPACGHRRKGRDFWTTVRHECCQSSRIQDRRTLSSSRIQMYGVTSGPAAQSRPRRLPLALTNTYSLATLSQERSYPLQNLPPYSIWC